MTAQIIDGKSYAEGLRGRIGQHVARLKTEHGITPGLAVVIVGLNMKLIWDFFSGSLG